MANITKKADTKKLLRYFIFAAEGYHMPFMSLKEPTFLSHH
jgi:hypothetical protein